MRVDLGRGLVAEVQITEQRGVGPCAGIDTDHLSYSLPIASVSSYRWEVDEAALLDALAAAARMGASEMMLRDRSESSARAQAVTLLAQASALLAPGVSMLPGGEDRLRELLARAVVLLGC